MWGHNLPHAGRRTLTVSLLYSSSKQPKNKTAGKLQEECTAPMNDRTKPATFTVSVFTRHSPKCPHRDDPLHRTCKCRKSLYLYENGKDSYKSAKTRSWKEAEKQADYERDL